MILDQFGRPVRPVPEFPVPEWVTREVMANLKRNAEALLAFNAAPNGRGPVLDASGRYASPVLIRVRMPEGWKS